MEAQGAFKATVVRSGEREQKAVRAWYKFLDIRKGNTIAVGRCDLIGSDTMARGMPCLQEI